MRAVAPLNVFVKSFKLLGVLWIEVTESDEVYGYIVLFHLFGQLDEALLIFGDRRAGEDNNTLALRFILAVLEGQLTGTRRVSTAVG